MTAHHAGGIAASTLGIWLLEDFGWRTVFLVGVVPLFVAVPLVARFIRFALTAAAVYSLGTHLPLVATYVLVFTARVFLFSAQTVVYAAVAHVYPTASRATAIGWTTGIGRFGAVFGPWMGGQLFAAGNQGWGFGIFALAALLATGTLLVLKLVLSAVPRRRSRTPTTLPSRSP